jgi:hypothetical protein
MLEPARTTARRTTTILAAAALTLGAAGAVSSTAASASRDDAHSLSGAQRTVIKEATRQFRDPGAAVAAGYLPTDDCVPGMGYHYLLPAYLDDTNIDPVLPELLVYVPTRQGGRKLGAIEYMRVDADQDKSTDFDRPTLFGHPFDGPMDGHMPGMPIHYDLHAWVYVDNPDGELIANNPDVVCP